MAFTSGGMRTVSLLYVLHLCRSCLCLAGRDGGGTADFGSSQVDLSSLRNPLKLDISKVDSTNTTILEEEERGMKSRRFTPRAGFYFQSVVYGQTSLWQAEHGAKCVSVGEYLTDKAAVMLLKVHDYGEVLLRWFVKEENKWKSVTAKEGAAKLDEMKRSRGVESFSLDVSEVDETKVVFRREVTKGTPRVTFEECKPKEGYLVSSVVDSGKELLKLEDGKKFLLSTLLFDEKTALLGLGVDDDPIPKFTYFEKVDGEWNVITTEDYYKHSEALNQALKEFRAVKHPQPQKDHWEGLAQAAPLEASESTADTDEPASLFTRNIAYIPEYTTPASKLAAKVNGFLFNVEEAEEDAVKVLKLRAKPGATTTELKYGEDLVWSGVGTIFNSSCPSATLYFDAEEPTLAVVDSKDRNNKVKTVYRHKDEDQWKNGHEVSHKRKLEELKSKHKA
ncbi:hypothetical protein BEWA_026060 [Theileria equi strain WA]|uniref:Signal peptide containing protein n=1 Tax=Theileria equi strain WA TaxID=1537102 RepID=L0AVX8_THEEQ|nr:hypothetical protein BEWA_026060 [Theileria equi strain WA]AFZ79757.1 hypothetical protein BEWA_026060 [Theileria equi strain WA]|eukprot:XP_004829423.1 hypothetical protein BEWA_026060 [Theileria equi strain WA]